jgi:hypothetical protein
MFTEELLEDPELAELEKCDAFALWDYIKGIGLHTYLIYHHISSGGSCQARALSETRERLFQIIL